MIKQKKKECKGCGELEYIWSKGLCRRCTPVKKLKVKAPPTKAYSGIQMPKHTAMYYDLFQYGTNDFIPSEISGSRAVDVHHIIRAGLIGYDNATHPLNLMALTREEHEEYGDAKDALEDLIKIHLLFCISKGVDVYLLADTLPPALNKIKEILKEVI